MCEHGFIGPCAECDGNGQQPEREPPMTENGRDIVTFPAQARIEHDRMDSNTDPPSDRIAPAPAELALATELIRGALVQLRNEVESVGWYHARLDQVAQVLAGAVRVEAERVAASERDKVLVAVRQLAETVQVLVEALEREVTNNPRGAA